jgi:hypothetical protein
MKDTFSVYYYTGLEGRNGWHLSEPFATSAEARAEQSAKRAEGIVALVESTRLIRSIGLPETPPGVKLGVPSAR